MQTVGNGPIYDSAFAPMDSTTQTVVGSASTASAYLKLAPGIYSVSLRGADSTCHVYFSFGADRTVTAAEPTAHASGDDASNDTNGPSMRGDQIERITVTAALPYVAFILSSGATSNKLNFTKLA
jgi:hypothetical protein